jgi:glycosyltransferase involved in cell wall biosynthesis
MPLLNEERHLGQAVEAILSQGYSGELQLVLAIGPGHDDTLGVARQFAERDARITVVENPSGRTPDALNLAVAAAEHEVVVRVDGHGFLSPGYLERAVTVLEETGAANVGGVMSAEGVTTFEKAVAVAMRSPLGVGGARFHTGGQAGPAETVYLGVFRREWLTSVGGYDPRFSRAQDWELNYRIRQAGGTVWFDPALAVRYRPRPTFRLLGRQYRDYGRWRRVVAREHKGSINARYLTPPTALVANVLGLAGGFVWAPLWLVPATYLTAITVGGLVIGWREGLAAAARVPAVLATMHVSWGWGFLTSRPGQLVPDTDEP